MNPNKLTEEQAEKLEKAMMEVFDGNPPQMFLVFSKDMECANVFSMNSGFKFMFDCLGSVYLNFLERAHADGGYQLDAYLRDGIVSRLQDMNVVKRPNGGYDETVN